jgi:hypothetical protein
MILSPFFLENAGTPLSFQPPQRNLILAHTPDNDLLSQFLSELSVLDAHCTKTRPPSQELEAPYSQGTWSINQYRGRLQVPFLQIYRKDLQLGFDLSCRNVLDGLHRYCDPGSLGSFESKHSTI